jgi:hypothetical protein
LPSSSALLARVLTRRALSRISSAVLAKPSAFAFACSRQYFAVVANSIDTSALLHSKDVAIHTSFPVLIAEGDAGSGWEKFDSRCESFN